VVVRTLRHAIWKPATRKRNSTGPRMSPCFTPMMLGSDCSTPSTSNLTTTSSCSAFSTKSTVGGTPSLFITAHSSALSHLSKAFTKSRSNSQHSCPPAFNLRSVDFRF
jgi:hypothetical protein